MTLDRRTMLAGSALLLTPDFVRSAHAQQPALTGALDTRIGKIDLVMGLPVKCAGRTEKSTTTWTFSARARPISGSIPIVGMNEWKLRP